MIAVRVLQVGNDASVAYCGLQFALWGADVAVLPSGDGEDPFTDRYLCANKRLVGQAVQGVGADVVLCACSDAEPAEIGVDTDAAIVARITPFAEDGVLHGTPATALLLEAASGYLGINGSPDREPVRAPGNLVSYVAGASAFGATLAALHKRLTTGGMERVVTSGLDVLASITPFLRSQVTGRADKRHGGPATGVRLHPVGDGHVSLKLIDNAMFANRDWFPRQSHPDLGEHRYGGFPWRFAHADLKAERPPPRLGEHTREILAELGLRPSSIDKLFHDGVVGTVLGS